MRRIMFPVLTLIIALAAACASTTPSLPRPSKAAAVTGAGLENFEAVSDVPMHVNYQDGAKGSIEEVVVNPSGGKVTLALPKKSTLLVIFFYVKASPWSTALVQTMYEGPIKKGSTLIDGRHYYENK